MKKFIVVFAGLFFSFNPTLVNSMYSDDSDSESKKFKHTSQRKSPIEKKTIVEKRKLPNKEQDSKKKPLKKVKREDPIPEEETYEQTSVSTSFSIPEDNIELVSGKGSKKSGGGPGGHYWNIFARGTRAGRIFINWINEEPLGEHASIQIYLNKASQGKHIGRHAYKIACEKSQYDTVYAYMSKKNLTSIRSARAAGFVQILAGTTAQVLMQWTRKKKE